MTSRAGTVADRARARRSPSLPGWAIGFAVLACAAVLFLAAPCPARADEVPFLSTPQGSVWLFLPPGGGGSRHPVVLILADRSGPDGRAVPYVDYLLEAGIAVLELGSDDPDAAVSLLTPPRLRAIALDLAPGRLNTSLIGILGFGGGGRAALTAPAEVPVAALYPSCTGLSPSPRVAPALLLHPDDPAEAAACRRITPRAEAIRGATHGWDHWQGMREGGTALLPHPDGSRSRVFSRSGGRATQDAAARVLRHFDASFREAASGWRDGG